MVLEKQGKKGRGGGADRERGEKRYIFTHIYILKTIRCNISEKKNKGGNT